MLHVERLRAGYGRIEVLHGVDLRVASGEVVGLLGPNGAGKTTLLRAVAGLVRASAGRVSLDGREITPLAAHERVARGVAMVPEGRMVFSELTVDQNLRLGFHPLARAADQPGFDDQRERVLELFEPLRGLLRRRAGSLSGGEQQMLAIGRALMHRPRVLAVDELSLGLAPALVARLLRAVADLADTGLAVLVVEQNVRLTAAFVSRAYLLQQGSIAAEGPPEELAVLAASHYLERSAP